MARRNPNRRIRREAAREREKGCTYKEENHDRSCATLLIDEIDFSFCHGWTDFFLSLRLHCLQIGAFPHQNRSSVSIRNTVRDEEELCYRNHERSMSKGENKEIRFSFSLSLSLSPLLNCKKCLSMTKKKRLYLCSFMNQVQSNDHNGEVMHNIAG